MSKKQLIVLSFLVGAVPAAGLLVKMLFSLLHLLSDQSSVSAVLWVVYAISLLGSAFVALLPLFLWLYYPAEGYAMAGGAAALQESGAETAEKHAPLGGDEDAFEDEGGGEYEDDGEQLFDEDDMDADDDEFDGGFDDDDN